MLEEEGHRQGEDHPISAQTLQNYARDTDDYFKNTAFLYDDHLRDRTVDIPFWVEEALAHGGPVLEIGCGTGRILLPIAQAGIAITGLDASANMLKRAQERISQEEPQLAERIRLIEGYFPAAIPQERFKQIFCTFGVFQYLLSGQEQALEILRERLSADGQLIIDVRRYSFPGTVTITKPVEVYQKEHTLMEMKKCIHYDSIQQILREDITWMVNEEGREQVQTIESRMVMRVYYRFELEYLLRLHGFQIVALYGDYQRHPISDQRPVGSSRRMIYLARPR